jgi:hypothetical protein
MGMVGPGGSRGKILVDISADGNIRVTAEGVGSREAFTPCPRSAHGVGGEVFSTARNFCPTQFRRGFLSLNLMYHEVGIASHQFDRLLEFLRTGWVEQGHSEIEEKPTEPRRAQSTRRKRTERNTRFFFVLFVSFVVQRLAQLQPLNSPAGWRRSSCISTSATTCRS